MDNFQEILLRDLEDFPEQLKLVLEMVTINESPKIVGSAAYRAHKYPSDIDVFERVTVNLPKEEALAFYAGQFRNIMEKIIIEPEVYYLDFKAGKDSRYEFEIPETLEAQECLFNTLYQNGLLTPKEMMELQEIIKNSGQTPKNPIEELKEFFRLKQVLRWTPEEVLLGRKELPGGKFISFKEALSQPAVVKLDVVSWILVRFQSIEVYFNLRYLDPEKGFVDFFPLNNYIVSLQADIDKYSSQTYYNPLKIAKRLWSLGRAIGCNQLVEAINPILQSDVAALNQIRSDIELLIDFIKYSFTKAKGQLLTEVDYFWNIRTIQRFFLELLGFNKRIFNHLRVELYYEINNITQPFYQIWRQWVTHKVFNRELIIKALERIKELLSKEIYQQSYEFIIQLRNQGILCPIRDLKKIYES